MGKSKKKSEEKRIRRAETVEDDCKTFGHDPDDGGNCAVCGKIVWKD